MKITTCPMCEKKALRPVVETVTFAVPGRPITVPDVPHLKCTACGERLFGPDSEPVLVKYRQKRPQRRQQMAS